MGSIVKLRFLNPACSLGVASRLSLLWLTINLSNVNKAGIGSFDAESKGEAHLVPGEYGLSPVVFHSELS